MGKGLAFAIRTAYKNLVFCEMFHGEETGWRECTSCGKRLHCGCIASSPFLELLDTGGVICKGCSKSSKLPSTPSEEKQEDDGNGRDLDKMVATQLGDDDKKECEEPLPPTWNVNTIQWKLEDDYAGSAETDYKLSSLNKSSSAGPWKTVHKSLVQTNLNISLSASSNSNTFSGLIAEERELSSPISSFAQGCRPRNLLPRLPNSVLAPGLESSSSALSQLRVARPPVEGRVKNQLLPRYWPRITDQELQQISGDSNSTVVPLFEKVLSASDAGRIGRLVLPKACAEAYFPPISQPEGLPLRIQDVKGKEWIFQFRFWPNNNSRMYVLEGVTPCIQSMQLQAGDTVTFSRMDPDGKLLMGFRKASSSISVQKGSQYSMTGGGFQSEPIIGNAENLPIMSGYSGLLQSLNTGKSSSMTMLSKHHVYTGNMSRYMIENNATKSGDNPLLLPEQKRRNIGAKSKRLLVDGHDSLELRLSWEEVQDMLRPPPSVKPSTISIDDHEFEEFDEPPVFGKSSIFIVRLSGELQQWSQCDNCFKWRKIPVDVLLPPKWTCQDNISVRTSSCSAPEELSYREVENLVRMNKEFKARRVSPSAKDAGHEHDPRDLETLGNAAADMNEPGASSVAAAATTKHPRHRPGCSCIVCIQPPSGKGKHKPTCTCNVCMTVKRRFKTLMMRKKKRQSEREAEIAKRHQFAKEEAEVNSIPTQLSSQFLVKSDNTADQSACQSEENAGISKGELDLNSCPDVDHTGTGTATATAPLRISMMSLLQRASLPLDTYLRQKGLTSLVSEEQATSSSLALAPPMEHTAQATVGFQEHEEESAGDLSERENETC
ncbi:B3 domain-containing transcription repressor VAL2 isoform X2 [Andrographis paniculata]|uniref:B3 domain-containing transcription repressor VAL2 isoform X2 n=1 Tax=Andrographis paniculata TaxID=175694 RepID=UPI0021E80661|nr:B3 domain-containing transcription repressor VAL2 isoform X2 [Andrographis paniculata]